MVVHASATHPTEGAARLGPSGTVDEAAERDEGWQMRPSSGARALNGKDRIGRTVALMEAGPVA
ncbi:hypothetical protein [Streptomyces sp. NPDC058657]|uniref:hypothetical protein n=1 Tax=unclassified Streptomyces TaxID=2593676 RepID=UPI0036529D55